MITKTSPSKMTKTFPLEKTDIHYDPSSEEISIRRDKFDALVKYVQALEERVEAAEDARDVAQYRARKAGKTADVLQALTEDILKGTAAIREWLGSPGHSVQELSERTSIPYATCHRIVNERLGTPNVEIGHLQKMVSAVSRDRRPFRDLALSAGAEWYPQFKRVLFGLPKGLAEDELMASWVMKGSEVSAVHGGLEIAQKMKELHPDLVLVDIAMPNLEKSGLERLKELAKDRNRTIIFTGEIVETALALLRGSSEKKHKAKEITRESEKAGG